MNKLKTLLVSSFIVLGVFLNPMTGLAHNNEVKYENGLKIEHHMKGNSHGWWKKWFGFWGNRIKAYENNQNKKPIIRNITVTSIDSDRATVKWITDVPSSSLIWYDDDSDVDTDETANVSRGTKVLNHEIVLTDLNEDTKYYVVVGSKTNGGQTLSTEVSFTTDEEDESDDTDPVISDIEVKAITSSSATVTWKTDEPSDSRVFFSTSTPVNVNTASSIFKSSLTTSHSVIVSGLDDDTRYYFVIESSDEDGNTKRASQSYFTTED